MNTETIKLTIRLPRQGVEFVKAYAKAHRLTVTEVIDRYLRRMQSLESPSPSPALETITGLVLSEVDAEEAYQRYLQEKHGQ